MDPKQIGQNFICLICTQIASNAVQTLCCGQIMCEVCSDDLINKKHEKCPNCRQPMKIKPSAIARRIISTIKVPCRHQCDQKIAFKQLKQHERKCKKRVIPCKSCSQKISLGEVIEHMVKNHEQKLYQICCNFHTQDQSSISLSKLSSSGSKIGKSLVLSKIKNSKGRDSHLGVSGKYYCGQKNLIGKCGCCDGSCGPTNGQNCDDCMQEDLKRFGLQKGYLINAEGVVCKADPDSGIYYCGIMQKDTTFCTKDKPCWPCQRTRNSIKIGRYKKLI